MQAVGPGPPVLNLKSLSPGRAAAYPAQDLFQSLLQERIVARGASSASALNRANLKAQLRQARPTTSSSSPLATRENSSRSSKRSVFEKVSDPKPRDLRRKASTLTSTTNTTKDQEPTQSLSDLKKSSSSSWRANLQAKAARLARGDSQVAAAAAAPNTETPPALKGLIEFLQQQPGQALKVPPDRIQDVQAFLLKAGLPPEQVESLLNSPRFQEQGLTAQDVQASWLKACQNSLQQAVADGAAQIPGTTPQQMASLQLQNITAQSDYQQLWQNLTLPVKALPVLRLELQQLGVPSESLMNLNEQNFPQGITLNQVWQLLQQAGKTSSTAAASDPTQGNTATASPLLLSGANDMEKWRQLLLQAGMEPELAQSLASGPAPTSREELRANLIQMAPPPNPPQDLETPKPLYLPENVRVRQVPWLQQADLGQGQGSGNGTWSQNLGFSSKFQEVNLPGNSDLNNFLAFLTGSGAGETEQALSPGATGAPGQSVNAYLTPEAREALWSQVQSGVLGNLKPGENQISLTLNPPELGKLNLTLNLKGENVEVTAVATHPGVAEAATAGVQQLALALSQQGLILTQFQFHHQDEAQGQPQLAFSRNSGDQQQTGKKETDRWEQPATPRRRRWAGGIDCFA